MSDDITGKKAFLRKPDGRRKTERPKLRCLDCTDMIWNRWVSRDEGRKPKADLNGLSFWRRFKEHRNAFSSNSTTSNYAKHALEHSHPFGPIQDTMQILQYQSKGAHLNTVEKYFICKEFCINNHLNDESNIAPNKIFDSLLKSQQP